MVKMLGKLVATWLTAFAIAGMTVWAGVEDDASEPDGPAADDGRAALSVSAPHLDTTDE